VWCVAFEPPQEASPSAGSSTSAGDQRHSVDRFPQRSRVAKVQIISFE
jgi:hypothetical protein